MLDVKLFLRVPSDLLKRRREERQTYALQGTYTHGGIVRDHVDTLADGNVWTDPPHYFEQIVQPAYFKAHEHMFEGGDVEAGNVTTDWQEKGLTVLRPLEGSEEMARCFRQSCDTILDAMRQPDIGAMLPE